MWLRIVLTGLAMEFIYGLYISFIRWYEPSILTSVIALGFLMVIGGYLVGRKANSKHLIQGALVGLVGVLFYVFIMIIMQPDSGQVSSDLQFWLENLAKIGGGAIGGYLSISTNVRQSGKKISTRF
jgi:putative membrane protein (TIGR04086 family)